MTVLGCMPLLLNSILVRYVLSCKHFSISIRLNSHGIIEGDKHNIITPKSTHTHTHTHTHTFCVLYIHT